MAGKIYKQGGKILKSGGKLRRCCCSEECVYPCDNSIDNDNPVLVTISNVDIITNTCCYVGEWNGGPVFAKIIAAPTSFADLVMTRSAQTGPNCSWQLDLLSEFDIELYADPTCTTRLSYMGVDFEIESALLNVFIGSIGIFFQVQADLDISFRPPSTFTSFDFYAFSLSYVPSFGDSIEFDYETCCVVTGPPKTFDGETEYVVDNSYTEWVLINPEAPEEEWEYEPVYHEDIQTYCANPIRPNGTTIAICSEVGI